MSILASRNLWENVERVNMDNICLLDLSYLCSRWWLMEQSHTQSSRLILRMYWEHSDIVSRQVATFLNTLQSRLSPLFISSCALLQQGYCWQLPLPISTCQLDLSYLCSLFLSLSNNCGGAGLLITGLYRGCTLPGDILLKQLERPVE